MDGSRPPPCGGVALDLRKENLLTGKQTVLLWEQALKGKGAMSMWGGGFLEGREVANSCLWRPPGGSIRSSWT